MKKLCLCLLMVLCCAFSAVYATEDPSAPATEAIASAGERIMFYHQDMSDAAMAAYPYNAIPCKSANFSVLGGNGCSIFAGLHAYQWLYGKFESLEEQVTRAQEMVYLLRGESPAVQGNGPYVSYSYAHERGAFKVIDLRKTEKSITDFFDLKRGILYLHASWEGGGHYFIAVGYTRHEIDGKDTFLLHIVDSGAAGTVQQFTAYDFATFAPAVPDETWLPAGEYWMPLQNGVEIAYGMWTRPETVQP